MGRAKTSQKPQTPRSSSKPVQTPREPSKPVVDASAAKNHQTKQAAEPVPATQPAAPRANTPKVPPLAFGALGRGAAEPVAAQQWPAATTEKQSSGLLTPRMLTPRDAAAALTPRMQAAWTYLNEPWQPTPRMPRPVPARPHKAAGHSEDHAACAKAMDQKEEPKEARDGIDAEQAAQLDTQMAALEAQLAALRAKKEQANLVELRRVLETTENLKKTPARPHEELCPVCQALGKSCGASSSGVSTAASASGVTTALSSLAGTPRSTPSGGHSLNLHFKFRQSSAVPQEVQAEEEQQLEAGQWLQNYQPHGLMASHPRQGHSCSASGGVTPRSMNTVKELATKMSRDLKASGTWANSETWAYLNKGWTGPSPTPPSQGRRLPAKHKVGPPEDAACVIS